MGSDLVSRVASRALTLKVPGTVNLVAAARDPGQGQTFSLPNDFTIEAITIQIGTDDRGAQGPAEDATALPMDGYQQRADKILVRFRFDFQAACSQPLNLGKFHKSLQNLL